MSYYTIKVYGLVCDNCEDTEEYVPKSEERNKLAASRRALHEIPASGWTYRDGKDLCKKCSAE